MKEYDAYLFDADGTLIDTRELIYSSFLCLEKAMGVTLPPREAVQATIGMPFDNQLRFLLGEGRPEEFYAQADAAYRAHMMDRYEDAVRAFPGADDVLRRLRDDGKKLAVVSSRRMRSLGAFLKATGLYDFFDEFVTPENTDKHKPDPAPALLAMELLGVLPERTVFIGDATFDIECGHGAGTDTVLVSWGMNPEGWPVQPDAVIHAFAELLPA